jgi:hypothetical protein
MFRSFAVAILVLFIAISARAQTQPASPTAATPATKPAIKKPAQKVKVTAKPAASADDGACDLGVIAAAGNPVGLKKIGITIFGNEYSEVPFDAWGVDDLIVARIRVTAGAGVAVRRIAYSKEALFDLYEKPGKGLLNDPVENLKTVVRQITANTHCRRYIIATRFVGGYPGTNQSLNGIGVVTHGPFGLVSVFAYFRVAVFDGQTFAIRDPFASFGARLSTALSGLGKNEFLIPVKDAEFPASPEAAAKDVKLRDSARTLVTERLDRILPEYLKQ